MLVIKINGVYYLRCHGPYVLLWLCYTVLKRGLFTPEPGMMICLQLSRLGDVTHKIQVVWDADIHDYATITSKDYDREEPF
jgi:hypothetical protein